MKGVEIPSCCIPPVWGSCYRTELLFPHQYVPWCNCWGRVRSCFANCIEQESCESFLLLESFWQAPFRIGLSWAKCSCYSCCMLRVLSLSLSCFLLPSFVVWNSERGMQRKQAPIQVLPKILSSLNQTLVLNCCLYFSLSEKSIIFSDSSSALASVCLCRKRSCHCGLGV